MTSPEVQRCRRKPYWTSREHQAVQYTGDNLDQIAQLTQGAVIQIQTTPLSNELNAADPAETQALLLLGEKDSSFLQKLEVGNYIIWTVPSPTEANDPSNEFYRHMLTQKQYEFQWTPPPNPGELHTCQAASHEAEPAAVDQRVFLSLRYTGDNKAAVAQFLPGLAAIVQAYDPYLKEEKELLLLTAYQDMEYIRTGNHLVIPVDSETGQTKPEQVTILGHREYQEEFEPIQDVP